MCLATFKEKQIAEKDITVYKSVYPSLRSLHKAFKYELNTLYKTDIKPSELEAFNNEKDTEFFIKDGELKDNIKWYGQGFHSFLHLSDAEETSEYFDTVTVICKIPKGSEYIINEVGFVISNQIILVKKLDTAN